MRRKPYHWCRSPRVMQEKRANQSCEYVRSKRSVRSLPDPWDDIPATVTRSWKDRRKHQYRVGKRGKEHTVFYGRWSDVWDLTEYFEQNDIPHHIQNVYTSYTYYMPTADGGIREKKGKMLHGYTVHYWTDKNIGIDRICPNRTS